MEQIRLHPIIDDITSGTLGQIIYQEQILRALALFGGLPVKRVHEIRKIISQKLGEAQFNASAQDFVANAKRLHGVSEDLAMQVWGRVVTSASYAFVYAHSLCYSLIGYWSMYMKVHHPAAFYTAQLRKIKEEKWPKLIRDAEQHKVEVRGVTMGKSGKTWEATGEREVTAGYLQLKGVGDVTADRILSHDESQRRATGKGITEVADLLQVNGIGPKTLEKFRSQIESDDPFGLLATEIAISAVRTAIDFRDIPLRRPNCDSDIMLDMPGNTEVIWLGMVKLKEYKDVFEDERARTGDDLETIRARIKRPDLPTSCTLHAYDDKGEDVYVRIDRRDYPKYQEALESIRTDLDVIWVQAQKSRGGFGNSIYVRNLVVIDPEDDEEDFEGEDSEDQ
jgi:DNA polymerase-3 subunit alpha